MDDVSNNQQSFGKSQKIVIVEDNYSLADIYKTRLELLGYSCFTAYDGVAALNTIQNLQLSVLNFSSKPISGSVSSDHLIPGYNVIDMFTNHQIAKIDNLKSFPVNLLAYQGLSLLVLSNYE